MAVFSSQRKVCGSAAALLRYYEEESSIKLGPYLKYHDIGIDATVLGNVAGSAAERLPGLDLELGLTRRQHADLHNGQWQGQQLVKGRYRHVWETDAKGRAIKIPDETGKLVKVPVMEPMLDKFGHEVIDPMNGKPLMKQKTESASVNGYDITFALDKSAAELIIARPELTDMVKRNFLQAVNTAMKVGVEAQVPLVVLYKDGVKTKHTAELVWFSAFGASSRPTDDSVARGYEADPHIHIHVFLSSMSYCQGKWKKIDGKELFRQGELRQSVCSNEFNRLMENDGVKIAYSDPDRKGHIHSEVQGSNLEARQFFSTQSKRLWELQLAFEREYKRPPTQTELKEIGSATKAKKSKAAKAADELGNLDQIRKWRTALHEAGIKLDIPKPGQAVKRESKDVRLDILIERLNRPEGVARDIESAAVFGPEVILPAVYRAAEGLGFDTDELNLISGVYRDANLICVRDALDPSARLYTTQAILDAENAVTQGLDHLARKPVRSVPSSQVTIAIRAQKYALDHEQEKLVREICGARHIVHGTGKAGSGKCLDSEMEIVDPITGLVNTIEQVVQKPELTHVLTLRNSREVIPIPITHKIDSGWKPTLKVTTASGREMITTPHHPYLTPMGWVRADALTLGDTLGLAGRIPEPLEPVRMDNEAVDVLAAFLTNGSFSPTTKSGYKLDTPDPEIARRMLLAGLKYGFTMKPRWSKAKGLSPWAYSISGTTDKRASDRTRPSAMRVLMESCGVQRGLSKHKTIPDCVYRLPNDQLARFIAVFWMSDGYVDKGRGGPAIVMASEKMLRQMQHLLLRFGIQSGIKYKRAKNGAKYFDAWRLTVYSGREFAEHIPLWGEKQRRLVANNDRKQNPNTGYPKFSPELEAQVKAVAHTGANGGVGKPTSKWEQVWRSLGDRKMSTSELFYHPGVPNQRLFQRFVQVYDLDERWGWFFDGDLWWDPVVSIEDAGERHVYDLTVEPTACFIASDVVVHNTSALKPAVEALRRSGLVNRVVVVSEARKRANETGEAVKAEHSWSVDALTIAVEKGWKPDDKTMVILDEVAMFSSVDMANTLGAIGDKARLVTIGDEKQQTAIGAAGWYADELDKRPAFELNKVHRQKDHRDVTASNLIREGQALEALESMHARGRVHAVDTTNDLMRLARDRWEHHREQGRSVDEIVLVNTGSNSAVDIMNRMVQGVRLDAGEVSEFECFDVAEQSTGRKWRLYKNDRVIFNAGLYSGLSQPILNGTKATIVKMDRDGSCRVRLDGEERREVTVNLSAEAQVQPIAPAYAMSANKMQGGEVSTVLVIPGNPKVSSLNTAYSSVTRGVDCTEVLLSREIWGEHPIPNLAEAWSAASEKHMATPYIEMMQAQREELTLSERQAQRMSHGLSL